MVKYLEAGTIPPAHLKPIAGRINATLHPDTSPVGGTRHMDSSTQSLVTALGELPPYDGLTTTARSLKPAVDQVLTDHQQSRDAGPIKELSSDLEIVSILETGGLDKVNARTEELLGTLRGSATDIIKENAASQLQGLLLGAIRVFPHLATGVRVTFTPGALARNDVYPRAILNDVSGDFEPPSSVTVPLPYFFTTGIHGSGERAASGASSETVEVADHRYNDKGFELGVEIEQPIFSARLTHFPLDEVASIDFVSGEAMSPMLLRSPGYGELRDRPTPIDHYLTFRDFLQLRRVHGVAKPRGITDEVWQRLHLNLWVPSHGSNLWEVEPHSWRSDRLAHGFLALSGGEIGGATTLYEAHDVPLTQDSGERFGHYTLQGAHLMDRILRKGVRRLGVETFTETDATARLLEVPVQQRTF